MTLIFNISKSYEKEISKGARVFAFLKYNKIVSKKYVETLNYVEKSTWNDVGFSSIEVTSKQS